MLQYTIRVSKRQLRYNTALLALLLPVSLITYYCIGHLDRDVSLFVKHYLFTTSNPWSQYTSSIPDTLLILVTIITVGSYSLFKFKTSHNEINIITLTYKMLAIAAPTAFITKTILKYVFGRTNTRTWLLVPHDYNFHFFNGGGNNSGFPSGHMLVVTALIASLWCLHPNYRPIYLVLLLLLALALIATNYHFVSDVIAGAYIGLLVESLTYYMASRGHHFRAILKT